jgi:hypothetical protein
MKNTLKLFGIIAFVAVIGCTMIACGDDGQGDLINGVWDRGDIVVTISGSTGVFTEIKSHSVWFPFLNNGIVSIGDQIFRNISYDDNLKWTGQVRIYTIGTYNTGWDTATFTISGQTMLVETGTAGSGTLTKK